ncbi:MAG: phosphatidate cytidylyltransferase [Bacteroidales bacterium]|nr:phosphatidate cytidylyltransferase [Bacteroidales bacterium]
MQKSKTSNLLVRTLTILVAAPIVLGILIWNPLAFSTVVFLFMIIGLFEFYRLTNFHDIYPHRATGILVASVMFILMTLAALKIIEGWYLVFIPLMVSLLFVAELFRNHDNAVLNLAFGILPLVYIALPVSMVIYLMSPVVTGGHPHWHVLFGYLIILWSHDTFAYLTGIYLGKHKLWERVSPKKTIEGSLGGLIFAIAASVILSLFFTELTAWQWAIAAVIISVTGTFGDLSESLLKRKFNVKDSGQVFPGHGGMLDRIDSILFSAPAMFCYLFLLNL